LSDIADFRSASGRGAPGHYPGVSGSARRPRPSRQALYILGDFFEAWIGDDAMTPFQQSICQALRQLSDSGTAMYLMHGNRDFLIGQAFCEAAGCTLLADPSVVELGGEQVLLMHGDTLCTRDLAYMKLRRYLRNPLTLWILRHLPLSRGTNWRASCAVKAARRRA
jgi:UDP-2,3-diacylglucosamine diphosphatase